MCGRLCDGSDNMCADTAGYVGCPGGFRVAGHNGSNAGEESEGSAVCVCSKAPANGGDSLFMPGLVVGLGRLLWSWTSRAR